MLSWSRLDHNPLVPFAYAGWAVTLQVPANNFIPGAEFVLPTPTIAATLWDIGHVPREPARDIQGRFRVVAIADTYADVSMDLASASTGWVGRERASFQVRTVHPEWCIDA